MFHVNAQESKENPLHKQISNSSATPQKLTQIKLNY